MNVFQNFDQAGTQRQKSLKSVSAQGGHWRRALAATSLMSALAAADPACSELSPLSSPFSPRGSSFELPQGRALTGSDNSHCSYELSFCTNWTAGQPKNCCLCPHILTLGLSALDEAVGFLGWTHCQLNETYVRKLARWIKQKVWQEVEE